MSLSLDKYFFIISSDGEFRVASLSASFILISKMFCWDSNDVNFSFITGLYNPFATASTILFILPSISLSSFL
ncbi:hypothetical protein [Clostridium neonatale]|uniref:hypothetical protein n=1 Tax=Clostridium neonatale TaxID=137838 RepID=UPI001E56328C|nr:hypothetical protein [Clostridium neonatale]